MATVTKIEPAGQGTSGTIHWLNQCIERGKTSVFSEVVTLNPGLAAELLRRNDNNRGIKHTKAAQYAADMRAGRWAFNGEPVIISQTGELNDGQHRMQAVVDANICLPFLFVFGLTRESRETVDQGAARGAGDYLAMGGMQNATTVSTVARLLIALSRNNGQSVETHAVTNAEVVALSRRDQKIGESAHFATTVGRKGNQYVAATVIGFCHYLFSQIDSEDANAFLTQVCTGEGLSAGCPAIAVRERLLAVGKSRPAKIAVLFRGWNFYRRGMKVKAGSLPSTMPLPALV